MDAKPSLKTVLKRLRLSGLLPTLPDRITYAQKRHRVTAFQVFSQSIPCGHIGMVISFPRRLRQRLILVEPRQVLS